ncbi:hypothetical protein TrLO_g7494 [Triparma laevis f. longispina]|uniref:Uncharacterized protein n=1 Tax=Triparma laevis f. longispina TaxID=1714387 RepID=A0A9W7FFX2_9STRA|nr:hypothetical protein TrLO_g7494 [Triparma laevis f. longispina]
MSITAITLPKSLAIRYALAGWAFFIAENTLLSHNRTYLITSIFSNSETHYHYFYGSLSTLASALTLHGYMKVRNAGPFRKVGRGWLGLAFGLQSLGLIGLSQMAPKLQIPFGYGPGGEEVKNTGPVAPAAPAQFQIRCPFDFKTSDHDGVHGIGRVSRHSQLWSFASFSLGAAAVTASLPQGLCLMGPLAVAVVGGGHQDYRFRRGMGGVLTEEMDRRTSNVPFWAMVMGRQGEVGEVFGKMMGEFKGLNAGVAVATAGLMALKRGRR